METGTGIPVEPYVQEMKMTVKGSGYLLYELIFIYFTKSYIDICQTFMSGIQGCDVQNVWNTKHAFGCFIYRTSGVRGPTVN